MKKAISKQISEKEDMKEEYDFSRMKGAVMLEPDVRKYFSNSEAVNKALRSLIAIIPSSAHTN